MGERGCDEKGEDESRERPERPVEVRRRRKVGGGVRRREGIECVDAAEEDLIKYWKFSPRESPPGEEGRRPTVFVSTSKWC